MSDQLSPALQLHDKVMHLSSAVADAENLQPTNSRKLQILVAIEQLLRKVPKSEILLVQRKIEDLSMHCLRQNPPFLLKRVLGRVLVGIFTFGDQNGVHAFANTMLHSLIGNNNASDIHALAAQLRVLAAVVANFRALAFLVPEILEVVAKLARSPEPAVREEVLKISTELFVQLGSRVPSVDIWKSIIAKLIQSDRSPEVRLAAARTLHSYIVRVNPSYAFVYMEILVNLSVRTLFLDTSGYLSTSLVQAKHEFTELMVACLSAFSSALPAGVRPPLGISDLAGAVAFLASLAQKHKDAVDNVVCALVRLSEVTKHKCALLVGRALVSTEVASVSVHAAGWGARALLRSQPDQEQVTSLFQEVFLPLLSADMAARLEQEVALEATLELGALLGGGVLRVLDSDALLLLREKSSLGVTQAMRMLIRVQPLVQVTKTVTFLLNDVSVKLAEASDAGEAAPQGLVGPVELLAAAVAETGIRVSMDVVDAVLSLAEKLVAVDDEGRRRLGFVLLGALMGIGFDVLGSKLTAFFHLWKAALGRASIAEVNKVRPIKTGTLFTVLAAVQSLHAFISVTASNLLRGEGSPQPRLVRVVLLLLGNVYQLVQTLVPSALDSSTESASGIDLCLALRGEVLACFGLIDTKILVDTYVPIISDPLKQFSLVATLLRSCTLDVVHAEGSFRSSTAFLTRVLSPASETLCVLADLADVAGDSAEGRETGDANVQFHLHALGKNLPSSEYFRSALGPMIRKRPSGRSVDAPWRANVDVFAPITEQQESAEWLWRSSTVTLLAALLTCVPAGKESLDSLTAKYKELVKTPRKETSVDLLMIGCTLIQYLRKADVPVPEGISSAVSTNSPLLRRMHGEIVGLVSARSSLSSVGPSAGSAMAALVCAADIRASHEAQTAVMQLSRFLREDQLVRESALVSLASVAHLVPSLVLQECGKLLVAHLFADIYEAHVVLIALARVLSALVQDPSQGHFGFEALLSELATLATSGSCASHVDIMRSCLRAHFLPTALSLIQDDKSVLLGEALDSLTHAVSSLSIGKKEAGELLAIADRFPKLDAKVEAVLQAAPLDLLVEQLADRNGSFGVRAQEVLTRTLTAGVASLMDDELFPLVDRMLPSLVRATTGGCPGVVLVSVVLLEALVARFAPLQSDDEPWLRRYEAELLTTLRMAFASDFACVLSAVRISEQLLKYDVALERSEVEDLVCDFRFLEGERRAEKTVGLVQRLSVVNVTCKSLRLAEKTLNCALDLAILFDRRRLHLDNMEIFFSVSVADVAHLKTVLTVDLLTAVLAGLSLWLDTAEAEISSDFYGRTLSRGEVLKLFAALTHFAVSGRVNGAVAAVTLLLKVDVNNLVFASLGRATCALLADGAVACSAEERDAFVLTYAKTGLSEEEVFVLAADSENPAILEFLAVRKFFENFPACMQRMRFPFRVVAKDALKELRRLSPALDLATATALTAFASQKLMETSDVGYLGFLLVLAPRVQDEQVWANVGLALLQYGKSNAAAAIAATTKLLDERNVEILGGCLRELVTEETGLVELVEAFSVISEDVVEWVLARAVDCPDGHRKSMGDELAVVGSGNRRRRFVEELGKLSASDRASVEAILREKVASERRPAPKSAGIELKLEFS